MSLSNVVALFSSHASVHRGFFQKFDLEPLQVKLMKDVPIENTLFNLEAKSRILELDRAEYGKVFGAVFEPLEGEINETVTYCHGFGEFSEAVQSDIQSLVDQGKRVIITDMPDHGRSYQIGSNATIELDNVMELAKAKRDFLAELADENPEWFPTRMIAHSTGWKTASYLAIALRDTRINGERPITKITAVSPFMQFNAPGRLTGIFRRMAMTAISLAAELPFLRKNVLGLKRRGDLTDRQIEKGGERLGAKEWNETVYNMVTEIDPSLDRGAVSGTWIRALLRSFNFEDSAAYYDLLKESGVSVEIVAAKGDKIVSEPDTALKVEKMRDHGIDVAYTSLENEGHALHHSVVRQNDPDFQAWLANNQAGPVEFPKAMVA